MKHKFNYQWTLKDAVFTKDKGTVFSCFACGGGSTMGYKLAGFDVIGCNEIDPKMNKIYVANHNPKLNYLMDIREMVKLAQNKELPEELYNLDVLDGSPPCSSFSTSGDRDKGWGKEKKFREGQVAQVLDTLFFDFIDLAKELQPKIVMAENVRGLLIGKAKEYVKRIYAALDDAGYYVHHYLLDAQYMGVPQRRERAFFICVRKDLADKYLSPESAFSNVPELNMSFNEDIITYGDICDNDGRDISGKGLLLWQNIQDGDGLIADAHERLFGKRGWFSHVIIYKDKICPTLTGHEDSIWPRHKSKYTSEREVKLMSSFPQDYDFLKMKPHYVCGMSVPPVMMANVATNMYEQWLSKLK